MSAKAVMRVTCQGQTKNLVFWNESSLDEVKAAFERELGRPEDVELTLATHAGMSFHQNHPLRC